MQRTDFEGSRRFESLTGDAERARDPQNNGSGTKNHSATNKWKICVTLKSSSVKMIYHTIKTIANNNSINPETNLKFDDEFYCDCSTPLCLVSMNTYFMDSLHLFKNLCSVKISLETDQRKYLQHFLYAICRETLFWKKALKMTTTRICMTCTVYVWHSCHQKISLVRQSSAHRSQQKKCFRVTMLPLFV